MAIFSNLRGGAGDDGEPSPSGAARPRRLPGLVGVWRGWLHAGLGWFLGAAGWVLFLPLVAGFMLSSSLFRFIHVKRWNNRQAEPLRDNRLRIVYVATTLGAALQGSLLIVTVPEVGFTLSRLPYAAVLLSLVAPCVWIFLNNWAVVLSKSLGIPPLLDVFRAGQAFEESVEGVLPSPPDVTHRPLGDRGSTRPNPSLAFLFHMAVAAGLASSGVVVATAPYALVRGAWRGLDDIGTSPIPVAEPARTPAATDGTDFPPPSEAPAAATATPTPARGGSAFDDCRYWPEDKFADDPDVPPDVAPTLSETYYRVGGGADEVGCPDAGVEARGGFYLSVLTGGESDPSLLIVRGRNGAVVYDQLFRYAWRLLRREVLTDVEVKKSTGVGDYQLFHLTGGACVLASRNVYKRDPFVVLPSIVSHAVMHLTIVSRDFPEVSEMDPAESIVGRGRFRAVWGYGSDADERILTKGNADEVIRAIGDDILDVEQCPDVDAFDAVAAEAKRDVEAEM